MDIHIDTYIYICSYMYMYMYMYSLRNTFSKGLYRRSPFLFEGFRICSFYRLRFGTLLRNPLRETSS